MVRMCWRDRTSMLILENNSNDAASLDLEFCRPGSQAIQLSTHSQP